MKFLIILFFFLLFSCKNEISNENDIDSKKNDENLKPLTFKTIGGSLKEILRSFKEAFKIKAFRKLCIATFLIFNAFNTVASFTFFIIVYRLFNGDTAAAGIWPTLFGSVGALGTTFIVIPIVARMSKMMGKKNAFLASQSISILGYLFAGIVIGPFVLGFIGSEGEDIMHFAEFGVVMMLFLIGLELDPYKFWKMRKLIFQTVVIY